MDCELLARCRAGCQQGSASHAHLTASAAGVSALLLAWQLAAEDPSLFLPILYSFNESQPQNLDIPSGNPGASSALYPERH